VSDQSNEDARDDEPEEDVGLIGGGGPAATIDGGDDDELDEHGDNLREADPGNDD
jgi:hypothetical protein